MSDETEDAVRRVMTPLIGWPRLDRWLAGVKAQAWEEGAAAAWLESGIRIYGDDYPRASPPYLPFSVRKTNPYKEDA